MLFVAVVEIFQVVPDTDVVIRALDDESVNVPEVVIAVPEPESAAGVILVTVPPAFESVAHVGTPEPLTFNTLPAEPIPNLVSVLEAEA